MSLRGALAAFGSDEKHLVLILDQLCQYVDDHHQKDAMKFAAPETSAVCLGERQASDGN